MNDLTEMFRFTAEIMNELMDKIVDKYVAGCVWIITVFFTHDWNQIKTGKHQMNFNNELQLKLYSLQNRIVPYKNKH